jgi:hypothetical protein
MQPHPAGVLRETLPRQIALELRAGGRIQRCRLERQHRPGMVPGSCRGVVQALVHRVEAAAAVVGQAVVAAPADLLRGQPALLGQPEHGRAHGAFLHAGPRRQRDHAAQPSVAAAVRDGIAVDRDDQRLHLGLHAQRQVVEQASEVHRGNLRQL